MTIKSFWSTYKTPERIVLGTDSYIPIRQFKSEYMNRIDQPIASTFNCENIKLLCEYFKIPIIRPQGIRNIPCIHTIFCDGIVELFNYKSLDCGRATYLLNFYYTGYGVNLIPRHTDIILEAKQEVKQIVSTMNLLDIEQVVPVVPLQ